MIKGNGNRMDRMNVAVSQSRDGTWSSGVLLQENGAMKSEYGYFNM